MIIGNIMITGENGEKFRELYRSGEIITQSILI
jgi:hypothetical protein